MSIVPQCHTTPLSGGPLKFSPVPPQRFSGAPGEVVPAWLRWQSITGARGADPEIGGVWLDCRYSYTKPNGSVYVLAAAIHLGADGEKTGRCFLRSCSCPDFGKRRGPASPKSRERFCKHLLALREMLECGVGGEIPGLIRSLAAPVSSPASSEVSS